MSNVDLSKVAFELLSNGKIKNANKITVRKLSDMREMYYDQKAVEEILKNNDPVIYEVYAVENEETPGNLSFATTIINPGKIGDEYFMTKGHFHEKIDAAEVYIGVSGVGKLMMQDEKGMCFDVDIKPHTIVYVPPRFAHRSINTGTEPLVFLAIYPSDAGHNYGIIKEKGFAKIVVERDGKPAVIDNPNY